MPTADLAEERCDYAAESYASEVGKPPHWAAIALPVLRKSAMAAIGGKSGQSVAAQFPPLTIWSGGTKTRQSFTKLTNEINELISAEALRPQKPVR